MAEKRSKKRVVSEHKLYKEHKGHDHHMCELVARRKMDKVADFARGATYICHICGRAAAKKTNLCEGVEI
jgi:hypothetical protein